MANVTFTTKIALVNKTTAQWTVETSIPIKGCPCIEWTDSGKPKMKIGDGVNNWSALPYLADDLTASVIISALGYTPVDSAELGVADGVATLDNAGKVPASQLPSYVDDVIEVDDIDSAPATGETGKIYIAKDTGKCYRWSGTLYIEISTSDIVTASTQNGYIKINGTDVRVYTPIQADWNETDDTSPAYIKNKPNIPSGIIVDDTLSNTSTNAIQNKVVKAALDEKLSLTDTLILNCIL
jgi:hypothetical protein